MPVSICHDGSKKVGCNGDTMLQISLMQLVSFQ